MLVPSEGNCPFLVINLGFALVALVLIRLGIVEGMTHTFGSEIGWTLLAIFRAGATWAMLEIREQQHGTT